MTGRSVSPAEKVLVVGAGLAGLAVARALTDGGSHVEIIDKAHRWSDGTGMYLPGNAHRALDFLGLADGVRAAGQHIRRQVFMDHTGRTLSSIDLDAVWGDVGPCLAIGRSELHEVLRSKAPEVRLGVQVASIGLDEQSAGVEFDDGGSDSFDLVVAADGLDSSIRSLVFREVDPKPVGQASWRFIVDGVDDGDEWTVMLGGGRTLLRVPLGAGRVYCYLDVASGDGADPTGGDLRGLLDLFGDFAQPARDLIEAAIEGGTYQHGPIEEVVTDRWVAGSVVLVGDAAHAMSPNMAQGAAMAFEDAVVLAESLRAHHTVVEGLDAFAARRLSRVRRVRDQTHRRDRIRSMPALVRDASLRLFGDRIYRANYSFLLGQP